MADDWRHLTWGELAILEYGKGLRGYKDAVGQYRVFGTNGPIGWHTEALCEFPTVIVGRKGAYRGIHYSKKPCFVIDTAFYLKPKLDFNMRWAYYELLTHDINSMDSGSAIPSTSRESFYCLPVRYPPLEEQETIANILGTLDDKIELNRRMNETLEAMARTIFKNWFVDFDPVRAKAEGRKPTGMGEDVAKLFPDSFEDSELGKIPKGWGIKSLDEIAQYLNGLALQKFPPDGEGNLPVIKISQLRAGSTDSADLANNKIPSEYVVDDGDVLFSWSASLMIKIWFGGKGALNQHLFKVTSDKYPKWFYYLWTLQHLPEFQHVAAGKATTMGHIKRHHLSDAKVLIPPDPLLKMADFYFAPSIKRIIINGVQSRTLASIRDALLPKLLSGESRVKDADRLVE